MCRSVRQTPHAITRSRTCPAAGSGFASSAGCNGVPAASSTIARMRSSLHRRSVWEILDTDGEQAQTPVVP